MKKNKTSVLVVLTLVAILGCNDDGPKIGTIEDLSSQAQQFLSMRNGTLSSYSAESSSMMNNSFQSLMQGVRAGGRLKGDSTEIDTTLYPNPWEWQTCAVVTETRNDDGSITNIRDYGDGCEEGYPGSEYWIHGKITNIWRHVMEEAGPVMSYEYSSVNTYENYGGRYTWSGDTSEWLNDGHYSFDGAAQYNTATETFTGEFSHDGEYLYAYNGYESIYKSSGHTVYTVDGWTTDKNDYEYAYDNNSFSARVTKPLVFKYSCNRNEANAFVARENYVWVNVSGIEEVNYSHDGVAGNFVINYGDGECDNIIWITENGKTVSVDLGELSWFCGTTASTGN
jgi:hypothetical protein